MRMMYYSVNDTGKLRKGKSESPVAQWQSITTSNLKVLGFDSCWENSDFLFPSIPVSLTEEYIILIHSPGLKCTITFISIQFNYYFQQIHKDNLHNPRIALANLGGY